MTTQNSTGKILVTGANGQLGKAIVENLLGRVPASDLIACVREPAKASAFQDAGVTVRRADFSEPATLQESFDGATQVLITSVDKTGEIAMGMHRSAIAAARDAGAARILYTSHMAAHSESLFAPAADHAATEEILAQSGVAFTALRHGFYAESALHLIGQGLKSGEIRVPEDGPVSWTCRADLAAADAVILSGTSGISGITPALTAAETFTMAQVADAASEISGRTIRHVVVSDAEWMQATIAHGIPEWLAKMLLGMYLAARRGEFAAVDPTLEKLLGRRPQTMRDALARFLA